MASGSRQARVDALRAELASIDAAAALFGLSSNLRYLTGFTDEPGERMLLFVVPQDREASLLVPELYADQVEQYATSTRLYVWSDAEDPTALLRAVAEELAVIEGSILLDDTLWATFTLQVQEAFSGRRFGLASAATTPLRARKDADELAAMKQAGEITDAAYEAATAEPIEGRTELELARRLEEAMFAEGAEAIAFETLVASGPNSALPHHRAGTRRIEAGDVVILDYGCRVDGYCSDMTRTVVCGRPAPDVQRAYDAVRAAHHAAQDVARAGVRAETVDAAARRSLTNAGFGEAFVHRTGHGVGLDVHESPYIVAGNGEELKVGMTFSIEPGAYLRGKFGVRLEDVVVLGGDGATPMTESPRELRCIN